MRLQNVTQTDSDAVLIYRLCQYYIDVYYNFIVISRLVIVILRLVYDAIHLLVTETFSKSEPVCIVCWYAIFPIEQSSHSCYVCSVLNRLNSCVFSGLPYLLKQKSRTFCSNCLFPLKYPSRIRNCSYIYFIYKHIFQMNLFSKVFPPHSFVFFACLQPYVSLFVVLT